MNEKNKCCCASTRTKRWENKAFLSNNLNVSHYIWEGEREKAKEEIKQSVIGLYSDCSVSMKEIEADASFSLIDLDLRDCEAPISELKKAWQIDATGLYNANRRFLIIYGMQDANNEVIEAVRDLVFDSMYITSIIFVVPNAVALPADIRYICKRK